MIANKPEKKAQNYWLTAETEVVTPRVSTSDVIVHENDSKLRLVEIEGLQLTALGLSAGNDTNRPVFFRMNWKEAFNCLGLSDVDSSYPRFNNLEDLLACYNHQFPGLLQPSIPWLATTINSLAATSSIIQARTLSIKDISFI